MARKLGETGGGAVVGAKLGDACDVVGVKLGDAGGAKLGEAGDVDTAGGKSGDTDVFDIVGRKFGDVANESERFEGSVVANSAWKSGEVEPIVVAAGTCANELGHTVSAPSSTWS